MKNAGKDCRQTAQDNDAVKSLFSSGYFANFAAAAPTIRRTGEAFSVHLARRFYQARSTKKSSQKEA